MISGGTGRVEGDPTSNELVLGRRGGGGVVGGSILGIGGGGGGVTGTGRINSGGGRSRDEPRRHTLGGGDHQTSLHHQQFNSTHPALQHPLHPHHLPPPHGQYIGPHNRHNATMDLEVIFLK